MRPYFQFKLRFVVRVRARFPQWGRRFAILRPSNPAYPGYKTECDVYMDLSDLSPRTGAYLEVRTERDGLILFHGMHHLHFDGPDEEQQFTACFEMVRQIMGEEVVTFCDYAGEAPLAADFCHRDQLEELIEDFRTPPPPRPTFWRRLWNELKKELKFELRHRPVEEPAPIGFGATFYAGLGPSVDPKASRRLVVESWRGTHDREVSLL